MIRERRPEDLDPLLALMERVQLRGVSSGGGARAWLETDTAELSWVYDMAPVHVAPTRNVVGHVLIYRPSEASPTPGLAACARRPVDDLWAIGRLVVKPHRHDYGIARHLLNEARKHIQQQGKLAVLDLAANGYLTQEVCEKYGFTQLPSEDPAASPMIYLG